MPSVEVQPGFSPTVSWAYDGEESATHPVYFSHKARVVYRHQMDGNIIDATCWPLDFFPRISCLVPGCRRPGEHRRSLLDSFVLCNWSKSFVFSKDVIVFPPVPPSSHHTWHSPVLYLLCWNIIFQGRRRCRPHGNIGTKLDFINSNVICVFSC